MLNLLPPRFLCAFTIPCRADGTFLDACRNEADYQAYIRWLSDYLRTVEQPLSEEQQDSELGPEVRTFGAYDDGTLAGYYELRQDNQGGVEIAYFGLLPEFLHRGFGGALLTSAIEQAWRMPPPVNRVWVHTCTRDHPRALANYQARGFVIYKVTEE